MTELQPRIIDDPVWGPTTIAEPVILELMDSPEMQRTKGICQLGVPKDYHRLNTFSRYDHMVGSMLAVRKVGGDLAQQVKALIHDINHTAFSHLPDWIKDKESNQDFQDETFGKFLRRSNLPAILTRYGFDVEVFIGSRVYPLAELDAPLLCADRLDYALRELLISGFASERLVRRCVDDLTTFDGRMVFRSSAAAMYFGWGFLTLWDQDWNSRESLGQHLLFRDILSDALKDGLISWGDFKEDDEFVLDKLRSNIDIRLRLENLKIPLDENLHLPSIQGQHGPHKFRWVDPELIAGGRLFKLTDVNTTYAEAIRNRIQAAKTGFVI